MFERQSIVVPQASRVRGELIAQEQNDPAEVTDEGREVNHEHRRQSVDERHKDRHRICTILLECADDALEV